MTQVSVASERLLLPHGACRAAIREIMPEFPDLLDDISMLRPRLEEALGGTVLDQLTPADIAKTEQAIIVGGFMRVVLPQMIVGTGNVAEFDKLSDYYETPMPIVLASPRDIRETAFKSAAADLIKGAANDYFKADKKWETANAHFYQLFKTRRVAGHQTGGSSILTLVPPEDLDKGLVSLINLVENNSNTKDQPPESRLQATHDLTTLLCSKASMNSEIEARSKNVDHLKGDIADVNGRAIFRHADKEAWRKVYPSGRPTSITTKCFIHQLFDGQDETTLETILHAGVNLAAEYDLFETSDEQ